MRLKIFVHRETVRLFFFAVSVVIFNILIQVGNIIAARITGPLLYGSIQKAFLLSSYIPFIELGILDGFVRIYNEYTGAGKKVDDIKKTVLFTVILLSLLVTFLGIGQVILFYFISDNRFLIEAAVWHIFYPAGCIIATCLHAILIADGKLVKTAIIYLIGGITTIIALPGIVYGGWMWQCIRLVLTQWIIVFLMSKHIELPIEGEFNPDILKRLIVTGLPIFLSGRAFVLFENMDKLVISLKLPADYLGWYMPAFFIMNLGTMLSFRIAEVYYYKACRAVGNRDVGYFISNFKNFILISILFIPLYITGRFFVKEAIEFILPGYEPGIKAAQLACIVSSLVFIVHFRFFLFALNSAITGFMILLTASIVFCIVGCYIHAQYFSLDFMVCMKFIAITVCGAMMFLVIRYKIKKFDR